MNEELAQVAQIAQRAHELLRNYLALSPEDRSAKRDELLAQFDNLMDEFQKVRSRIEAKTS